MPCCSVWSKRDYGGINERKQGHRTREFTRLGAGFLQALYDEGLSRKTFVQYRDHLCLLGDTIIRDVSLYEEYQDDPLEKLRESVADDGILPDHYDQMTQAELKASSVCAAGSKNI